MKTSCKKFVEIPMEVMHRELNTAMEQLEIEEILDNV